MSEVIYLGSKTAGECMPTSLQANAMLQANIALTLPSLQAQIAGLIELQAKLSIQLPTISASLEIALELVAALELSISIGAPSIDFQLSAVLELLLKLQIELGNLQVALAFALAFDLQLGAAGIHLYAYQGEASELGQKFQGALATGFPGGQPNDQTYAVMLATTTPQTKVALELLFGVNFTVD